ncbi:MAG: glutamine--fructose-6-phosphate transaminase (isomerizing) [Burkholderiales bacterium]|jgi:glucosamine--fructose-6-phosphate aminotransferase (isomerizing)|nr:glutamine--fructose-6-phosphate transaminase (isomerizing) [Burkholderiales bacterium]
MCGIVGAVAAKDVVPMLLEGIARLEYRGYDSTGLAVVHSTGALERLVSTARVADLAAQADAKKIQATTGISHTRWATHGRPTETNAHPHTSRNEIALVHNGIIENYETLRETLKAEGYEFITQTDTEVIAHLVHKHWHAGANSDAHGDLRRAVQATAQQLTGAYAIAVVSAREPGRLVGARFGSPLVIGRDEDGSYLASDAAALLSVTQHIAYLEEGDVVDLTREGIVCYDRNEKIVERTFIKLEASTAQAELGPYRHFMQKEIFEQPRAIADTLEGVEAVTPALFGEQAAEVFSKIDRVLILACGTSHCAGQVAKQWIESLAQLPCQVEIASEYRYRDSVPNPNALVIVVSQSGETADTLAALNHAKALGHTHTLSICNVATSAMVRQTELCYLTRAGVEVGVASTKAFTTQLVALFLLALTLAKGRGRLTHEEEAFWLRALRHLPSAMQAALGLEPQIIAWAEAFTHKANALFLGRGLHYPIAQEGSLKLKEISYIHAEAYPAGELKHGPLALVDADMPVVAIAPNNALLEKLKSNLQEVRARGAELYVVADLDSHLVAGDGIHVLRVPEHASLLSPIVHVAPLQLLAYHTAVIRGTDVDKPRNLAKSVTVE